MNKLYEVAHYSESNNFNKNIPKSDNNLELEGLKREKAKYERAVQRLEDLYLFDDESMSEKDYLIKKNKIIEKLNDTNFKIKQISLKSTATESKFMIIATTLNLNDALLSNEHIDIKNLITDVGRDVLKEFVNAIIDKVIVKNRTVVGIRFKNGIENKFIYRA